MLRLLSIVRGLANLAGLVRGDTSHNPNDGAAALEEKDPLDCIEGYG